MLLTISLLPSGNVAAEATSHVSGSLWWDDNQNGIKDSTEFNIPGIKVMLYSNETNRQVASQVTNSSGNFFFTVNNPGSYYIVVDKSGFPAGTKLSPFQVLGGGVARDSDFRDQGGVWRTNAFTLEERQYLRSIAGGFIRPEEKKQEPKPSPPIEDEKEEPPAPPPPEPPAPPTPPEPEPPLVKVNATKGQKPDTSDNMMAGTAASVMLFTAIGILAIQGRRKSVN